MGKSGRRLLAVQQQKGRITKYAAQALMGKVLIYQGTFDAAAPILESIITANAFSLVTDFASMYLFTSENGPESVFEIQYSNTSPYYNWAGYNRGQGNYAVQQCGVRGLNGSSAMPFASGWSTNLPTSNLANAYEAGDQRKNVTVLDIEAYKALLNPKVKLVAVNHVSNAIGTINPIVEIISLAHEVGAKVLIDGAQSVAHLAVDVQALDMDFFVFSAHKLFGPTGVGVLYGKRDLLESMPPYQGGGEMIKEVSFSGTTYNELPYKFEAGTPNIADVIAFGAALDYVQAIPSEALAAQEEALLSYATLKL